MRRILISATAVFIAAIIGYVSYSYYTAEIKPLNAVVVEVNDTSFNMRYYVKMLDAFTQGMEPDQMHLWADSITVQVVSQIQNSEVIRQGANGLGIEVTDQEINEKIEENKLPNEEIYRDQVRVALLNEKLLEHFSSLLPETMEQANIQVMLVESEEVADETIARISSSEDFADLITEFSCDPQTEGDLGWLPQELMPNSLIGDAVFSPDSGEILKIEDESASKNIGYWLIEITDKDEEKGVKARAILLGSQQEADEVKTELTDENFADLAEQHSQFEGGEGSGELGWLKEGDMNSTAFDEVAFALELNVISEPVKDKSVQTEGGYWVVEVLDKGEHELSEETTQNLAGNGFMEWFEQQKEGSIIKNHLDEDKKSWAIERVLEER